MPYLRLILSAVLVVSVACAEEFEFTRAEAVKQLVAHLKVSKQARLSEEDSKKALEDAADLINNFARQILPDKLAAVSKEAFDLMFVYPVELNSNEPEYLNDALPMYVSAVLSHVNYQRVYPTLSPEGLKELRGNISEFITGVRSILRKDERIDPAIIDSVLEALEKEMQGAVNNPNVQVYRVPVKKAAFDVFMKDAEETLLSRMDTDLKKIGPGLDAEGKAKAVRSFVRFNTSRAAGKLAQLAKPPELANVDIDKLTPGHKERMALHSRAESRVWVKHLEEEKEEFKRETDARRLRP